MNTSAIPDPGADAGYPIAHFAAMHPAEVIDLASDPHLLAVARNTVRAHTTRSSSYRRLSVVTAIACLPYSSHSQRSELSSRCSSFSLLFLPSLSPPLSLSPSLSPSLSLSLCGLLVYRVRPVFTCHRSKWRTMAITSRLVAPASAWPGPQRPRLRRGPARGQPWRTSLALSLSYPARTMAPTMAGRMTTVADWRTLAR